MNRLTLGVSAVLLAGICAPAQAHPVPFSYVDVRLRPNAVELVVVAHIFDIAHDLGIEPPEKLLEPATLTARSDDVVGLLRGRLNVAVDGRILAAGAWAAPDALPERQSIRLGAQYGLGATPGRIEVAGVLFPYNPQHKTFLNFYESGSVAAQAILDKDRARFEYFAGTRQGIRAVIRKFLRSGVHHILIGPDHLLFLVGLLLLGGSMKQLLIVVTAFTIAHSLTLSLAALRLYMVPASVIEPAIALSLVYVGADNLLVSGGRDMRGWIAFAFGLIHGFGFANVLRDMDLPGRALGWTLFSFNIGVEIGQLVVVVIVASALAWIRARSEAAGRALAFAGSIVVMLAGTFWFVQRVFFSGGTA